MQVSTRHQLWILAVGAIAFFANLGATRLWDQDEAYFARTAVEMHERNEWVVPYFNGEPFAHKPPLMFWMMRFGFLMFGVTEFAARFWSGVFGLATALVTYHLGKRIINASVGLWAGLAMCTTIMFDVVGRAATPDSYLVFFCTLALYLFVRHENWQRADGASSNDSLLQNITWSQWFGIYAVMGLAFLTKGPIGVVLPGAVIGLYLLMRDSVGQLPRDVTFGDRVVLFLKRFTPARVLGTMWRMRPFTAILAVTLVAGPWCAAVTWQTGGEFMLEFFGVHHVGRFLKPMDNHGFPIWAYVPLILVGFFPWSIFGIPTTLNVIRGCREKDKTETPMNRPSRFFACWILVYFIFFSLAATKLPSYVLPLYPALALATASFAVRWLQQPASVHRWWPRLSFGSLAWVGIIMAIAGPMLASRPELASQFAKKSSDKQLIAPEWAGDLQFVGWLGGILLVGGGVCLALSEIQRRREAMLGLSITAVAFCGAMLAGVAVTFDRHQTSPQLAEVIRHNSGHELRVAQYGYFRPSLVYYVGTRIEECASPKKAVEFLKSSPEAYLVTTEKHYAKLFVELPADAVVLSRYPQFPEAGTLLVVGRKADIADRGGDAKR
jgi:4-amino-4-deoxy-L-arabinose transferase-like glycosyltransferase